MDIPPDLIELLSAFAAAEVRYLLVAVDFEDAWPRRLVIDLSGVSVSVLGKYAPQEELKKQQGAPIARSRPDFQASCAYCSNVCNGRVDSRAQACAKRARFRSRYAEPTMSRMPATLRLAQRTRLSA